MRLIDLRHVGRERVISSWLVGDVIVDPGPSSCLDALLEGLAGAVPRALALTHIHLDHAGAAGTLCERWPELEVWVHERGAPHLVDPERLMSSAARLWGEDMDRLWGEMRPVPAERIRIVGEGTVGDFRVTATPGHASHHVCYLHEPSRTLFAGDTAGVRIAGGPTMAPTPPPDVDVEAWLDSVARLRAWRAERVASTHFGLFDDVDGQFDELELWFDTWVQPARELDEQTWAAEHDAWLTARSDPEIVAALGQAAPIDQGYRGLRRYWSRRERPLP
jgi:glyoxylase-like metal-dependent hydrolase (beta-lactamase superfamily II)